MRHFAQSLPVPAVLEAGRRGDFSGGEGELNGAHQLAALSASDRQDGQEQKDIRSLRVLRVLRGVQYCGDLLEP